MPNTGDGALNVPIPDPSALTTAAVNKAFDTLRSLLEAQIATIRAELEAFKDGHEEKHTNVVEAAIQHRKDLSEASIAIVQAQVDAHFESQQAQIKAIAQELEFRFSSSDLRYQQRYDAQSDALRAAAEAQQKSTAAALASAKEAVATALNASEKAVTKAEESTSKLIPRAEVEARLAPVIESVNELHGTSERIEKNAEAILGVDRVTDAKFVTFRTLIDSQADKVALALAASNKAVDAAFASSAAAILKAEVFNEKRFDIITKQIDELKSYRDATTGKGDGAVQLWGFVAGGVGLLIAVTSIILAFNN